jgi:hypothetical protein
VVIVTPTLLVEVSVESGKVLRKWTPTFLASWLETALGFLPGLWPSNIGASRNSLQSATPADVMPQPKLLAAQHVGDQTGRSNETEPPQSEHETSACGTEQNAEETNQRAAEIAREPLCEPAEAGAAADSDSLSNAARALRCCALKIGEAHGEQLSASPPRSQPSSQACPARQSHLH